MMPVTPAMLEEICAILCVDSQEVTSILITTQGVVIKGERGLEIRIPMEGQSLPAEPPVFTSPPQPWDKYVLPPTINSGSNW